MDDVNPDYSSSPKGAIEKRRAGIATPSQSVPVC